MYIVGYHAYWKTNIPLFINIARSIFSYGVSQYDKKTIYIMSFNVSEAPDWVLHYLKILSKIKLQLFEN